jgi:hypothetical protein
LQRFRKHLAHHSSLNHNPKPLHRHETEALSMSKQARDTALPSHATHYTCQPCNPTQPLHPHPPYCSKQQRTCTGCSIISAPSRCFVLPPKFCFEFEIVAFSHDVVQAHKVIDEHKLRENVGQRRQRTGVHACTAGYTRHTPHVTRHTSHVTRRTSYVTRHTPHVTRHTSHVTRHTSHAKQASG